MVHDLRQRELRELLADFKAQHRAGICKVPTFRQLLRLQCAARCAPARRPPFALAPHAAPLHAAHRAP
eukprot:1473075-Prymnesium_polylepis.1